MYIHAWCAVWRVYIYVAIRCAGMEGVDTYVAIWCGGMEDWVYIHVALYGVLV